MSRIRRPIFFSEITSIIIFTIWHVQPCSYDTFIYEVRDSGPYTTPSSLLFLGLQYGEVLLFCPWVCPLFLPQMFSPGPSIVEKQRW